MIAIQLSQNQNTGAHVWLGMYVCVVVQLLSHVEVYISSHATSPCPFQGKLCYQFGKNTSIFYTVLMQINVCVYVCVCVFGVIF